MGRLLSVLLLLFSGATFALEYEVIIEGVEDAQETNIRAFLSLEREKKRDNLSESRLHYLYRQAPDEIVNALRPFGYFRPEIVSELSSDDDGWKALFKITPGPLIKLSEVDFRISGEGAEHQLFTKGFALKKGEVLNQAEYEKAKQTLLAEIIEEGYLDARYTEHKVRVDLDAYTASIHLHMDSGIHYHFGEVRFLQDVLDDDFLRRYPDFNRGEAFSQEKLLDLQSALIGSEYYSHVEIRTLRKEAEGNQVPVEVALTPNKPNRYRAGLGYSTDTGPRLSLDWTRRRIGRNGHHMNTELRIALPQTSFVTDYTIPLERPTKDSLSFSLGANLYDTDTRKGWNVTLNTSHSASLENDWRRIASIEYVYEDYEVGAETGTSYSLIPSVHWSQLKTQGKDFLLTGHRVQFMLLGAFESLLSKTTFLQGYTNDKFIYGLNDRWRLLSRLEAGATYAAQLQDLPASKRFFAGGDNSVRGFDIDGLGPKDSSGDIVGGRYLFVGSVELERHIQGPWSAAVFTDFGNAFDPDFDNRIAYSAGAGVRWRSPVGPIRFDVAFGLSEDDIPWRIHVVVGPEL